MRPETGWEWVGIFFFIGSVLVCLWAYSTDVSTASRTSRARRPGRGHALLSMSLRLILPLSMVYVTLIIRLTDCSISGGSTLTSDSDLTHAHRALRPTESIRRLRVCGVCGAVTPRAGFAHDSRRAGLRGPG
jgi:hypothetical protein